MTAEIHSETHSYVPC